MYDNGYIVKCRSILTNDICLSEASHKADVFLVCISYLTYSLKKCINNLAVWKIRVNTHTHTQRLLMVVLFLMRNFPPHTHTHTQLSRVNI